MNILAIALCLVLLAALPLGCASVQKGPSAPQWALAIHGGAGVIDRDATSTERDQYTRSLVSALENGRSMLIAGASAVDAVESVVRQLEDDPLFNAGRGAVYTYEGTHELDASIMDGSTLACGAVAGVRTVRNPIGLARRVMERSPHVLLIGDGAERFADMQGVERVENTWFDTPRRREQWEKRRREMDAAPASSASFKPLHDPRAAFGTVGAVALDVHGKLAAATSTGGMTCKRWGRVGDTPIIGAGTYADTHAAISCTGTGEEFIRHGVARQIALIVELQGQSVQRAAERVVFDRLKPDDGGVIVVGRDGSIAMVFNSDGMFRGAADSAGRFDVGIWKDLEKRSSGARP
ncbi:MAG: isoaspartyl peptidase/L-asparaginase [Phycisphaerales bacterium]|nr:isoaspartyl peptidase/L-asparaginase [Phycisphaerales bacterium]